MRIAHLTTVHPRTDTRIRVREVGSLARAFSEPVGLFVQDGKGDALEADGRVQVTDVGRPPGRRFIRMIVGTWRMWRAVRTDQPRLVHFHDPELIPLAVILKCLGYRVVYDVHEDLPRQVLAKYWIPALVRSPVSWTMSVIEWLAARLFDAIVPAGPKITGRFPPHKTTLVRNFPILNELVTTDGIPFEERPPYFAYIGGLSVIRGIHEMIQAIDCTHGKDGQHARLSLAGEFQPASLLTAVQSSAGWQQVDFHGWADRKQVAQILGNVRAGLVILHPTANYPDAYPTKMFEYMSVGLPVIVSDFPLWRGIVEDARCGLVVDPLNPQSIAEAMQWILDNPVEAEAMGRRGREAAEKHYNWETEAKKLVALYKKLLSG